MRERLERSLLALVLGGFALYYLLPLLVMIATSLRSNQEIRMSGVLSLPHLLTLDGWRKAWSQACIGVSCDGLRGYFGNSLLLVIPAVFLSTGAGALNGYVLAGWRFRGSELLFGLLLFGCFIPYQIILLPMARFLGMLGLAQGLPALILVHVVYGLSFTTLFFRNYYVALPQDLIRAAIIDGAGFFTIFRRVILPLSPPILIVTVIWQFTGIWNDFLFGAVFSAGEAQPITVALNNLVNTSTGVKEYNVDMAATLIAGLPTLVVYAALSKYFVRGLTAGSIKG